MKLSLKADKKKELRQPDMYISPVIKVRPLKFSGKYTIEFEAIRIIEAIIEPMFAKIHAMFPYQEKVELHLSRLAGERIELKPNPFVKGIYFLSPHILKSGLFSSTLTYLFKIAPMYYGINVEKPKGADYWILTKTFEHDFLADQILNSPNQDLQKWIEKGKEKSEAKEKAEAEAKAKAEEQARINEVLLYGHNCLQALISSVQVVGAGNG